MLSELAQPEHGGFGRGYNGGGTSAAAAVILADALDLGDPGRCGIGCSPGHHARLPTVVIDRTSPGTRTTSEAEPTLSSLQLASERPPFHASSVARGRRVGDDQQDLLDRVPLWFGAPTA
ncbi:hypothetical protein [Streptomyces virginiae]|uniref:hypothetical protein n=1 Tax=Streptomyces virginiae TaxID=1961 RepID=UPI0036EE113F